MRSSVSKSVRERVEGSSSPVIDLKNTPKANTHDCVGVFLSLNRD
jgi:hypothetical protein